MTMTRKQSTFSITNHVIAYTDCLNECWYNLYVLLLSVYCLYDCMILFVCLNYTVYIIAWFIWWIAFTIMACITNVWLPLSYHVENPKTITTTTRVIIIQNWDNYDNLSRVNMNIIIWIHLWIIYQTHTCMRWWLINIPQNSRTIQIHIKTFAGSLGSSRQSICAIRSKTHTSAVSRWAASEHPTFYRWSLISSH